MNVFNTRANKPGHGWKSLYYLWIDLDWSECLGKSGIWTSLNGGLWPKGDYMEVVSFWTIVLLYCCKLLTCKVEVSRHGYPYKQAAHAHEENIVCVNVAYRLQFADCYQIVSLFALFQGGWVGTMLCEYFEYWIKYLNWNFFLLLIKQQYGDFANVNVLTKTDI